MKNSDGQACIESEIHVICPHCGHAETLDKKVLAEIESEVSGYDARFDSARDIAMRIIYALGIFKT